MLSKSSVLPTPIQLVTLNPCYWSLVGVKYVVGRSLVFWHLACCTSHALARCQPCRYYKLLLQTKTAVLLRTR